MPGAEKDNDALILLGKKLYHDTRLSINDTQSCASCHSGALLAGQTYQKLGLLKPYKNSADTGRQQVTRDLTHNQWFKVPTLRNIALTAPYFHDDSISTLEQAVKTMAELQLGKTLSDQKVNDITASLSSLSDTRSATNYQ